MAEDFDPQDASTDQDTKYRFFPVVRRGYPPARSYDADAEEGNAEITAGGSLAVTFDVDASGDGSAQEGGSVDIDMYGPGHVDGIDRDQVVRREPEPDTSNYPPNYFATVEFDAPDVPWLFSPVADDTQQSGDGNGKPKGRGLPWLCLVVVEKTEEVRIRPAGTKPLPSIEAPVAALPPLDEAWAWAHAQTVGSPQAKDKQSLTEAFGSDSKLTRSRLVSPRNLQGATKYVAAVVPVFEAGRQAGLGNEVPEEDSGKMALSWAPNDTSVRGGSGDATVTLPVYHHWEFTTGQTGDFEYLARQLEPRNLNDGDEYDIGFRDVDVTDPGPAALELWGESDDDRTARLGGALRQMNSTAGDYAATADLRELLNVPADLEELTDEDYEVVGPQVYGGRHAQVSTLPATPPPDQQWLSTLNLHPGHRLAAAVGTTVVRDNQEQLMASAWDQVGEIRKANRLLAATQLSRGAMETKLRTLGATPTGWTAQFTGPAHDRVLVSEDRTAGAYLEDSSVPRALTSAPFRRLTSGSGRLAKRLDGTVDAGTILEKVVAGEVSVASTRAAPAGTARLQGAVDLLALCERFEKRLEDGDDPTDGERQPSVRRLLGLLDDVESHCDHVLEMLARLVEAAKRGDWAEAAAIAREAENRWAAIEDLLDPLWGAMETVADEEAQFDLDGVSDEFTKNRAEELYGRIEHIAKRDLVDPGDDRYDPDDVTEARFDVLQLFEAIAEVRRYFAVEGGSADGYRGGLVCGPDPATDDAEPPDLGSVTDAVEPVPALRRRAESRLGGLTLEGRRDPFDRVMAYPEFPDPTFRDLEEVSEDYLLPGVSEIPRETFGALSTNPQFIEAFMAGLNHEMADELLWRGFPTDRRGSYFRQFWDPSARVPKPEDPEDLKDITEMHTWDDKPGGSKLGSNITTGAGGGGSENPGQGSEPTTNVVVVVRGELLRRYPQTTIYATKAKYVDRTDGSGNERVPEWPTQAETDAEVDTDYHRFPIFRGGLDPDVNFLGFDLEPDEATGADETASLGELSDDWVEENEDGEPVDDLGWFFVLEEAPGEVRFGLDVNQGDVGERPNGVTYSPSGDVAQTDVPNEDPEHGWGGLSWGHLVESEGDLDGKDNVSVYLDRPGEEDWKVEEGKQWVTDAATDEVQDPTLDREDEAVWGKNSAHMAYITWQRPVRIAIHADDLLPGSGQTGED